MGACVRVRGRAGVSSQGTQHETPANESCPGGMAEEAGMKANPGGRGTNGGGGTRSRRGQPPPVSHNAHIWGSQPGGLAGARDTPCPPASHARAHAPGDADDRGSEADLRARQEARRQMAPPTRGGVVTLFRAVAVVPCAPPRASPLLRPSPRRPCPAHQRYVEEHSHAHHRPRSSFAPHGGGKYNQVVALVCRRCC